MRVKVISGFDIEELLNGELESLEGENVIIDIKYTYSNNLTHCFIHYISKLEVRDNRINNLLNNNNERIVGNMGG